MFFKCEKLPMFSFFCGILQKISVNFFDYSNKLMENCLECSSRHQTRQANRDIGERWLRFDIPIMPEIFKPIKMFQWQVPDTKIWSSFI